MEAEKGHHRMEVCKNGISTRMEAHATRSHSTFLVLKYFILLHSFNFNFLGINARVLHTSDSVLEVCINFVFQSMTVKMALEKLEAASDWSEFQELVKTTKNCVAMDTQTSDVGQ